MPIESRFKFTDPIFYDGEAWNYLKYDGFKNSIEAHIILNHRKTFDEYIAYLNIIDSNITSEINGDTLHIYFADGKSSAEIKIIEKRNFFRNRKYLRSIYRFNPTNLEIISETRVKNKTQLVGNEKWDRIANFINSCV